MEPGNDYAIELLRGDSFLSSLPTPSDWSVSASTRLALAWLLKFRRPQRIVELGTGVSTVMLATYAASREIAGLRPRICSIDHEITWLEETRKELLRRNLADYVNLVHAPLTEQRLLDMNIVTYSVNGSDVYSVICDEGFDLCVIDGPPGAIGRLGSLPLLAPFLAHGAMIVMDDAYRPKEQDAILAWSAAYHTSLGPSNMYLTDRGMYAALWKSRDRH